MFKAYRNLSPKARMGVGLTIIAWGCAGPYLSDRAEEVFGFTPTEQDKKNLEKLKPRLTAVDRGVDADEKS